MCMKDVEIGRAAPGNSGSVSVDNANPTLILQGNARRFAIIITPPNAQRVTLGFGTKSFTADNGPTLANGVPLQMNIKDYGEIICRPIYGIVSGAAPLPVGFIESVLADENL